MWNLQGSYAKLSFVNLFAIAQTYFMQLKYIYSKHLNRIIIIHDKEFVALGDLVHKKFLVLLCKSTQNKITKISSYLKVKLR